MRFIDEPGDPGPTAVIDQVDGDGVFSVVWDEADDDARTDGWLRFQFELVEPVGGQPQPDLLHEQIYAALADRGLVAAEDVGVHPAQQPRPATTEGDVHTGECRSEDGITIGLVDGLISTYRVLAQRDLTTPGVLAALRDLTSDYDADTVHGAGRPDTPTDPDGVSLWCDVHSVTETYTPGEIERIVYALHGERASLAVEPDGDRIHAGRDWRDVLTCHREWLSMGRDGEGYRELADGWIEARGADPSEVGHPGMAGVRGEPHTPTDDVIEMLRSEYDELRKDADLLAALVDQGVSEWHGYDAAFRDASGGGRR